MSYTAQELSESQLSELSENPDNVVMKYTDGYTLSEEEKLKACEVRDRCKQLESITKEKFEEYAQTQVDGKLSRVEVLKFIKSNREELLQYAQWQSFKHTHPQMFGTLSNPTMHTQRSPIIHKMIDILEEQERTGSDGETACRLMLAREHEHLVPQKVKQEAEEQKNAL